MGVSDVERPEIVVRPCRPEDVPGLTALEPPGSVLAETFFARQQAGGVTYLVGWFGVVPAGTGVLVDTAELGSPSRPELKNLHVYERFRGAGVGTAMVREAESIAAAARSTVLVIGVATDNLRARALYERLGYLGTGALVSTTYSYLDDSGAEHTVTEESEYLEKRLCREGSAGSAIGR